MNHAMTGIRQSAFRMTILPVLVFIMVFLAMGAPAQAQGIPLSPLQPELREEIFGLGRSAAVVGLGERVLENLDGRVYAMRIVRGALSFVGLIFVIMILYAGFLWMTGGGSEERIGKAKKILSRAFIGMFIIVTSYSVAFFVQRNIVRVTFQTMFDSAQSCDGAAVASCCSEWLAFQNAASAVTTPAEGFSWAYLLARRTAPETEASSNAYRAWLDCTQRRREAVGL